MLGAGYHWTHSPDGSILNLRYGSVARLILQGDGQYEVKIQPGLGTGCNVVLHGRAATLKMGVRHVERCIRARIEYPFKRREAEVRRSDERARDAARLARQMQGERVRWSVEGPRRPRRGDWPDQGPLLDAPPAAGGAVRSSSR